MIRTANRVALYARFSSDNQRSESIDAQVRAMKAYCRQHGYVIVNTYIDEAKSATTDRRPAFQQMITDSGDHLFDILLVHKLDRFARNRYDSAVYKRELKKNGVTVYSVLENLDDSPESIMMESVLEGMSEYYSQNLAREVMKGMRETALQCKHTGGKPPLGYDIDPNTKKLVINDEEAKVVRLIYSMFSAGYGYSLILSELHEHGYKTKRGEEFRRNSLYGILTNRKYAGIYIYNQSSAKNCVGARNTHLHKPDSEIIAIEGGCPQIVDENTFNKVQLRMRKNKHTGGRNNAKENYLLSGKVYCADCGRSMVGNARRCGRSKLPYITYRCPTQRYSCSNKEINRDYLENYIVALLDQHVFNARALRDIIKQIDKREVESVKDSEDNRTAIQAKLDEVTEALKNVADAVAAGLLSDVLIDRLHDLEQQKASLEETMRALNHPVEKIAVDPQVVLSEYAAVKSSPASPAYKEFVRSFIERIDVGHYSIVVTIKTGLDIFPDLNTTFTVRRQEVYEGKGRLA